MFVPDHNVDFYYKITQYCNIGETYEYCSCVQQVLAPEHKTSVKHRDVEVRFAAMCEFLMASINFPKPNCPIIGL